MRRVTERATTSTKRSRLLRILRSPFLWVPFLLALAFHPGVPLTLLLWTDFELMREHTMRNSVRASMSSPGVLEIDYEVVVMMPSAGTKPEDWKRHRTVRLAELKETVHEFAAGTQPVEPSAKVYRPKGLLPVHDTAAAGFAWTFPDEECIVLREGAHWKRANELVGGRVRVVTVDLDLWRTTPPPGMPLWRVLGTPLCLAADVFGLPRIAAYLIGWGRAMDNVH